MPNLKMRVPRDSGALFSSDSDPRERLRRSSSESFRSQPSIDARIAAWLDPLSPHTRRSYKTAAGAFASACVMDGPRAREQALEFLATCDRGQALVLLESFAQRLIESGRRPSSVATYVQSLRSWLDWLENSGFGGPGAVRPRLRLERERRARPAPHIREVAQAVARLEKRGTHGSLRDAAILSVVIVLALRRSELAGIQIQDLESTSDPAVPVIVRVTRKGSRVDRLDLPRAAWRRLRAWLQVRAPWIDWSASEFASASEDPVFCRWRGHATGSDFQRDGWMVLGRDHVHRLTTAEHLGPPHRLRRSAARWISEHGGEGDTPASIDHVRSALGHRDLKTTSEYLDSGGDDAREERIRLSRAMERAIGK